MRHLASALVLLAIPMALAVAARADTVVLQNGKRIRDVVVSRNDDQYVVINPFRSRIPEMTWGIPKKNYLPRDEVAEVVIEDPPRVEFLRRASTPGIDADERVALAKLALEHRWKEDGTEQLILALLDDPGHQEALELFGRKKWESHLVKNPQLKPEVRELEAAYLKIRDPAEAEEAFSALKRAGSRRDLVYMERARRSAALQKGRRERVPLTVNSREAPGATYAIYVPESYDPLIPTALVVGLHGGGDGGKDDTLVAGSGEQALPFYIDVAREWNLIVVCPSAIEAPWGRQGNRPVLEGVLAEMNLLYNIDPRRVYLTGHSMGGFGTWYWSVNIEDTWAAVSPCAGGGGRAAIPRIEKSGLPIYIYHGTDDRIVRPDADRDCALALLGGDPEKPAKNLPDFVYTELDGVGHGFPTAVRKDIFRWFMGRYREGRRVGRSSFDAKVGKIEREAFGDPTEFGAGDDDASLKDLIAELQRGGGSAAKAAEQLGAIKERKTVTALAKVLRSKKSNADVRAEAARALGLTGLEDAVSVLARLDDDEDYRVVEAATEALGRIGGEEARGALVQMTKSLGRWFRDSFRNGRITHTEYEVRLASFSILLDAIARTGDAATFHDLLRTEIIDPVFPENDRYQVLGDEDSRFKHVSPNARRKLVRDLGKCLRALRDPDAAALLKAIAERWSDEPSLVKEVERALGELEG